MFRIGVLPDSTFIARALAPFRLIACASPAYLATAGTPATPAELSGHACLGYATAVLTTSDWMFLDGDQQIRADVQPRLRVNDARALLVAAVNGFGVAFIAEDLARDDLRAGRLIQVLPGYPTPSRPVHLIYHPDRRQAPKLKSFIAAVTAELALQD